MTGRARYAAIVAGGATWMGAASLGVWLAGAPEVLYVVVAVTGLFMIYLLSYINLHDL